MTCEEYVTQKLAKDEDKIEEQNAEIALLRSKVKQLEGFLFSVRSMLDYKEDTDTKRYSLSVYDKYDKRNFNTLMNIFGVIGEEEEEE